MSHQSLKGVLMEIRENEVYTPRETQEILKISPSTMTRMIKKGLIRAAKIGKQYRILCHELLRLLSPEIDTKATNMYQSLKQKTIQIGNNLKMMCGIKSG